MNTLNKIFKLEENNTSIIKEIMAGIITFFSIAYILFLNPEILANPEASLGSLYTSTVLCAIISTLIMALLCNKPLILASSMGLNSVMAITISQNLGFSYSECLSLTLVSAVIFLILTLTKLRTKILNAIPNYLVTAIGIGISLFICFVGLKNSGLVTSSSSTIIELGNLNNPVVLTSLISLILIIILTVLKVKGSIIITLIATLFISILLNLAYGNSINYTGIFSLPEAPYVSGFINGFTTLEAGDTIHIIIAIFTFTFLAIFNSVGSIALVKEPLSLDDKELDKVMLGDSLAFFTSSLLGTSPSCILAESMTGIKSGAKTRLSSIIVIILLILALFLSPLISLIGIEVTSSILILIGITSLSSLKDIDFTDLKQAIPSFFAILLMPFTYSIINGIAFSIIFLTIIDILTYDKEKSFKENINPILIILTILFILYYVFLLI